MSQKKLHRNVKDKLHKLWQLCAEMRLTEEEPKSQVVTMAQIAQKQSAISPG